jgi:hypothetical protein
MQIKKQNFCRQRGSTTLPTKNDPASPKSYSNSQLSKPQSVCGMPRGARHTANKPSTLKREAL